MYSSIATKLSKAVSPPIPHARLTCSFPNGLVHTISLLDEDAYITAPHSLNQVDLEQVKDKAKAIIRRARKRYYLQVLTDDAQTYVNDQLVHDACSLKNGDRIQVGDVFAVYYTLAQATA